MGPRVKFLEGSRLLLRRPEKGDIGHLVKWSKDREIRQLTGEVGPMSPADAEAFLRTVKQDPNRVWFVIVDKAAGEPIGECGLLRIFLPWRTADLTMIIGERGYWGKGYSQEAMELLLKLSFEDLRLHRLAVGVPEFNERALRFYTRFGFREEGRQQDGYFHKGRYRDFVMMRLLEEDYREHLAGFPPTPSGSRRRTKTKQG